MVGLLALSVEARHVELAVVLDLQGVEAAQGLHFAVEAAESVCLFGQLPLVLQLIESLGRVHGEDHAHVDLAGEVIAVIVVGQGTEVQPLDEGVELAGRVAEIDGRADQQHICGKDAVQQRTQIVLPEAPAALSVLALA